MTLPPITGRTHILGLIADPVIQAASPAMATRMLSERGLLGTHVLLPMHVDAQAFPDYLAALRGLRNFGGAIISMPHKIVAAGLIDQLTPQAQEVGAVNVIRRLGDGRLEGTMLDGEGFVSGLRSAGHAVQGARIVMAGAGGAASALAFALVRHGCAHLHISNRTAHKADHLAERVRKVFPSASISTGEVPDADVDIVINGTSQGMQPGDALPLPLQLIQRTPLAAECVLAPVMTPMLIQAQAAGQQIHQGLPMLAAQMNLMLDFMGAC